MSFPSHLSRFVRFSSPLRPGMALIAITTLALGACGGGGGDSDPPDDGGGKEPPSASINVLEGDWVQKGCVKAGAQSFK